MKRFISTILILLVILVSGLLITSCNDNENDTNDSLDTSSTQDSLVDDSTNVDSSTIDSSTTDTPCEHTGGNATCKEKAVCALCQKPYGELNEHSWNEATCTLPKTCGACGTTDGETLSHQWNEATCTLPKTCGACGTTEGEALSHQWNEATCTLPKTCGACGATEGEALNHQWNEATCIAPKNCDTCGATEGEALNHQWNEATCIAPKNCDTCGTTEGDVAEHTYASEWSYDNDGHYKACLYHADVTIENEHADENKDGLCDVCEFVVKAPTTFTVYVVDDSGILVQGATIALYSESSEITVTTNERGEAFGEFIYYDTIKARVVELPEGYRYTANEDLTFDETSLCIIIDEVVFYEFYVLDRNENGIEGACVNILRPFEGKYTDENGYARFEILKKELEGNKQLAFISSMPDGYVLYDTQFNALFGVENNSTYTAHADLVITYTFSAKDNNGAPLKNAVFSVRNQEQSMGRFITDESGMVIASLPPDNYSVEISHLSAFFSTEQGNTSLSADITSYEATFTESTEMQMAMITVVYDDGSSATFDYTQVYAFKEDNINDVNLLSINANGQAATFMPNEDRIFFALDKDMNYGIAKFKADDPTDITMVMTKNNVAGSKEHPLPIIIISKLPYAPDNVYFNYNHAFTAGESLYLTVFNALAKTVTINGNLFTLEYNGNEIAPREDGIISLTFTDIEFGEDAIIKITAKEDATEDIAVEFEGTEDNPILVYSNKPEEVVQEITLLGAGQIKYYLFTNTKDYLVELSITAQGAGITIEYLDGQIAETDKWLTVRIIANEAGNTTITFNSTPINNENAA